MIQPKRSLRAIDEGTRYDISGNLRRLARAIERGDHGKVAHVVVGLKSWHPDPEDGASKSPHYETLGFGNATIAEMAYTTDLMKRKMTGA